MLEHVAWIEVLKIQAGGFTVASLANGLVCGQDDFHYIVSFITVGSRGIGCRLRPRVLPKRARAVLFGRQPRRPSGTRPCRRLWRSGREACVLPPPPRRSGQAPR